MKKLEQIIKLFVGLMFVGGVLVAVITGGAYIVGKLNELGQIPDGKAGELAGYLLKWNEMVISIVEKIS